MISLDPASARATTAHLAVLDAYGLHASVLDDAKASVIGWKRSPNFSLAVSNRSAGPA